jgi:hypothetical protein
VFTKPWPGSKSSDSPAARAPAVPSHRRPGGALLIVLAGRVRQAVCGVLSALCGHEGSASGSRSPCSASWPAASHPQIPIFRRGMPRPGAVRWSRWLLALRSGVADAIGHDPPDKPPDRARRSRRRAGRLPGHNGFAAGPGLHQVPGHDDADGAAPSSGIVQRGQTSGPRPSQSLRSAPEPVICARQAAADSLTCRIAGVGHSDTYVAFGILIHGSVRLATPLARSTTSL